MALSAEIAKQLPYLRRYARALGGSQKAGDGAVRTLLEKAAEDPAIREEIGQGRLAIFRQFAQVWMELSKTDAPHAEHDDWREQAASKRLSAITPLSRQALLLTTLEEFSRQQAGKILGVSSDKISELIEDAVTDIDNETTTNVLIIEDEPLISMQLEDLVRSLGHEICGSAATRTQAIEIVEDTRPGLVLADIQLADGSSGLDAVDDILAIDDVPVIFVTAYPERLLTGDRPEPTYLITKPFKERTVRAAISQALFFESSKPIS
jgi:CheY-like chemotaxis protein